MIEIERPQRAKGIVHKLIAETAKGIAAEEFEKLSSDNGFHKRWPHRKPFVGHNWRLYIPVARQVLTEMLGLASVSQEQKDAIYGALLLDAAVNPKRMSKPATPSFFLGHT